MSELIKYANTDVLDGLKYVRVGLANIISHVINTGEDFFTGMACFDCFNA